MITQREKALYCYQPERRWTPKRTTNFAFNIVIAVALFRTLCYAGLDMLAVGFLAMITGTIIALEA